MNVEEHEEIPWSMLVDQDRGTRSRTLYAVAGTIVVLVVLVAGFRWVEGHRHGIDPVPDAEPVPTTRVRATTSTLLSESELIADDRSESRLAAIARAEWFVTDYFTVDGVPAPGLLAAFVEDAALPELPQLSGAGGVSFVEWARATAAVASDDGFVVTVLFRTLYENEEQHFERSPVRAVDVVVVAEGTKTAIADLPILAATPVAHGMAGWPQMSGEATDAAIASALERAGSIAQDPVLVESGGAGSSWRVVLLADDPSGVWFPLVVRSAP